MGADLSHGSSASERYHLLNQPSVYRMALDQKHAKRGQGALSNVTSVKKERTSRGGRNRRSGDDDDPSSSEGENSHHAQSASRYSHANQAMSEEEDDEDEPREGTQSIVLSFITRASP
jgi:hypothetical protein